MKPWVGGPGRKGEWEGVKQAILAYGTLGPSGNKMRRRPRFKLKT